VTSGAASSAGSTDPVDANYMEEKERFKGLLTQDEATVSQQKANLSTLKSSQKALSKQLKTTEEGVATTSTLLNRAQDKLTYDAEQHDMYKSKEVHHKKEAEVTKRIEENRERVLLHAQELEKNKERLQKALKEKADLDPVTQPRVTAAQGDSRRVSQHQESFSSTKHNTDTTESSLARQRASNRPAPVQSPHMEAAVEAVQTGMDSTAIEAELKPKIALLKARYVGHPAALQEAIQALVSATVSGKVDDVIRNNKHASQAMNRATQHATEKREAVQEDKALHRTTVKAGVRAVEEKHAGLSLAKEATKAVMKEGAAAIGAAVAKENPLSAKSAEKEDRPAKKEAKSAAKKASSSWLGSIEEALDPFD